MAFLRPSLGSDSYTVRGGTVGLRPLVPADYAAWAALRSQSRDHLVPYEPQWLGDELDRGAYRRRLRHYVREQREDLGYAFGVFRARDDVLAGGLSLSNVRRGVTQTASLGYWLGVPFLRQGYMNDAVAGTISFAFRELKLHRIEAATLPDNEASIRVLERNGFVREGFARRYLKINGAWKDHILFGLLVEDVKRESLARERLADGVATP